MLELAVFLQLAATCAPHVSPETLAAVARTESGFNALAIHDNTTRQSILPATLGEAVAVATEAVSVQRHSLDLGLMQINSANLPGLGMSVADAFDPCRSLRAAGRVLAAGYLPPADPSAQQQALHRALSRYNTGDADRGVVNGYVARVQASAELVVPAIRLRGDPESTARPDRAPGTTQPPAIPLPSWDVFRQARARGHGGALIFGLAEPTAGTTPVQSHPRLPDSKQVADEAR